MLNSTEIGISTAYKNEMLKNKDFSCFLTFRCEFIMRINVKMPIIVGILSCLSMINFTHSWVWIPILWWAMMSCKERWRWVSSKVVYIKWNNCFSRMKLVLHRLFPFNWCGILLSPFVVHISESACGRACNLLTSMLHIQRDKRSNYTLCKLWRDYAYAHPYFV